MQLPIFILRFYRMRFGKQRDAGLIRFKHRNQRFGKAHKVIQVGLLELLDIEVIRSLPVTDDHRSVFKTNAHNAGHSGLISVLQ
ncbi:MAG: hypothetical protein EA420_02245 [Candidatus Competibacteraceae bacterium]|nr:MAG: hypothetical protein EA420_02245 [Candidatus Competibacteraceae bacterium]